MIHVIRLVLILALGIGAVIAPDVSAARVSVQDMAQMDTTENADQLCGGCDPAGFADGIPCEGGCPVPCGSIATAGIIAQAPSGRLTIPFGAVVPLAEPLIPLGADLPLDPFPPKLPV